MNKLIQFLTFCYHPVDGYNTLGSEHVLTIADNWVLLPEQCGPNAGIRET